MKTRIGFVSNSSSSSFVIALPKKPKTFGELYDMMFPDVDPQKCVGVFDSELNIIACEAAKDVFSRIKN